MDVTRDAVPTGALLGCCSHLVHLQLDQRLRCYGISPVQCRSLMFLHDCGGSASQQQLQRQLMVKPSTANGIVDRLEERGLLQRSTDRTDARRRVLRLTEAGCEFLDEFQAITREVEEGLRQDFTPEELAQLRALLGRVAANLQTENKEVGQ